jgi:pantoate--beta-alanine ligase
VEIIRTVSWMKEFARGEREAGRIIGLAPTMGALHEGHLSLVKRAAENCSTVIASIFVNPAQFGPKEDFAKYPRDPQADSEKLVTAGVRAVFMPESAEIYPANFSTYVNVEGLSDRFEGRVRPGHFRGVATVVLKLLQIVQPEFAYFGRKDAQQARVISQMAADFNLDAEIVVCPIVRGTDGLAMSSRNAYLNSDDRKAATVLYRGLSVVREEVLNGTRDVRALQAKMRKILEKEPLAKVDYAEIVDSLSFEPIETVNRPAYVLIAARFGQTRLIDNMLISFADNGQPHVEL